MPDKSVLIERPYILSWVIDSVLAGTIFYGAIMVGTYTERLDKMVEMVRQNQIRIEELRTVGITPGADRRISMLEARWEEIEKELNRSRMSTDKLADKIDQLLRERR